MRISKLIVLLPVLAALAALVGRVRPGYGFYGG